MNDRVDKRSIPSSSDVTTRYMCAAVSKTQGLDVVDNYSTLEWNSNILYADISSRIYMLENRIKKLEQRFHVINTKIHDLPASLYRLIQPIDVILEIYPDEVIAIIPELELWSDGLTQIEALNNLKMELLDLYDDLNESPNEKLGEFPKSWKRIINSFIEKK
ncbi:MAG: hypothetical protein ACE5EA_03640 [Nitrospirota bacterium]